MNQQQAWQLAAGALFVVAGSLFFADRLGWGPPAGVGGLWPLLIIAMGLVQMSGSGGRGRRHGYVWIAVGALLLLDRQGMLPIRDSWPLLLVTAGIYLVLGRQTACRHRREVRHGRQ